MRLFSKMKFYQIVICISCVLTLLRSSSAVPSRANKRLGVNRQHERYIELFMNLKVNPCDNFYEYACGKWQKWQEANETEDIYTEVLGLAGYKASKELARQLDVMEVESAKPPGFVRKLKSAYETCVGVEDFDHLNYLVWLNKEANFTLPLLGDLLGEENDWIEILAGLRRYGLNGILVEEDMLPFMGEKGKIIITLKKPESESFKRLSLRNFRSLMNSMSLNINSTALDSLWHEVQWIEKRIKEITNIEEEDEDEDLETKPMEFRDLPFPWLKTYLSRLLNKPSLDENLKLILLNQKYFEALENLARDFKAPAICKYLTIRFLWYLHQNTPTDFSHWECADMVRNLLPLASNWLYQENRGKLKAIISEVEEMFQNIIQQFNQTLNDHKSQIHPSSFEYLLGKLKAIKLKIGNLPSLDTASFVETFYANISLSARDFYGNHLKLLEFSFHASHEIMPSLAMADYRRFFNLDPPEEGDSNSPYYVVQENTIIVPFTSLRQPIYHPNFKPVYKYSGLGAAIGHEIFHSFDYTGLQIDAEGQTNDVEYKRILRTALIAERLQCLENLNPQSVDEKIADISGLRYAYKAFIHRFPEAHESSRPIHGKQMKLSQIFFLNFAQYYCDTDNGDYDEDEHGLASDRVNDALSHLNAFSEVFNCTAKNEMYVPEKCQMWI
ncbi:neprilysin-2-like [Musca domestica]|uniref:Neprilysin-2-like n=1 Tax=Musca domestica TaxID=7370 RepID=A0A1I8MUM3_MUSDO|nr:neprilysin-2-like [Musca domestica]